MANSGERRQRISRAAEYFVAAELNRRGAYAVTFAGNMPELDLLVSNISQTRTIKIQVKAKLGKGDWQVDASKFLDIEKLPDESQKVLGIRKADEDLYLVFVSFVDPNPPEYWIVPWDEFCRDIAERYRKKLERHSGKRARNPQTTHHAVKTEHLEGWRDRWDVLKIWERSQAHG